VNSAIAYINASTLFGSGLSDFQSLVSSGLDSTSSHVPSTSPEVISGFKAIYGAAQKSLSSALGQIELLLSINTPGEIRVQAALQRPYSMGRMYITSSNIFDPPVIDPNYFSNPAGALLGSFLLPPIITDGCSSQISRFFAKGSNSHVVLPPLHL
jgi:choline dehydrogenase